MPLEPTISLKIENTDPFTRIGTMIGAAGAATRLQRDRATMESDIAQRQAESQSAQSRATVDAATVDPLIQQQRTAAQGAQFQLDSAQAQAVQNSLNSVAQDPHVLEAARTTDPARLEELGHIIAGKLPQHASFARAAGVPQAMIDQTLTAYADVARTRPQAFQQFVAQRQKAGIGAPGQVSQDQIPVNQQYLPATDTAGNPAIMQRNQFGAQPTITAPQYQGQTGAIMPTGPLAPGEKERIPTLSQEVVAARGAAQNAGVLHTTNAGILQEIDKAVATGTAGPALQRLMSGAGVVLPNGWGGASAEEKASAYDMVGKYLERNALTAAQSMGPQTNAGLEAQIKANGSIQYNPTAIKQITRLNDALVSGAEAYAPGLAKAMAANPTRGVLAKEPFDAAWGQAFKPEVFELFNAYKAKDTAEAAAIARRLGYTGPMSDFGKSPQGIEMKQRAAVLEQLSKTGGVQ